jgi:hypothetical protein
MTTLVEEMAPMPPDQMSNRLKEVFDSDRAYVLAGEIIEAAMRGELKKGPLCGIIDRELDRARREENEACAKVAENVEVTLDGDDPFGNLQIAAVIRARVK